MRDDLRWLHVRQRIQFKLCRPTLVSKCLRRTAPSYVMGCLHDPANVQQTSGKSIQNTGANAGRLLDRVNTLLAIVQVSDRQSVRPSHS